MSDKNQENSIPPERPAPSEKQPGLENIRESGYASKNTTKLTTTNPKPDPKK